MENTLVFVAIVLMVMKLVWYLQLIASKKISPAPATYIVAMVSQNISAWSYYATGKPWRDGLVVYVAVVEVTMVAFYLVTALYKSREIKLSFNRVQYVSLAVMVGIVVYWYLNQDPIVTFVATQALMVLAYIPTLAKAKELKKAFDSPTNWILLTVVSVVAGAIPFLSGNVLGELAAVRAFALSSLTVGTLLYYDRLNGYTRFRDELQTLSRFYRRPRG